MDVVDYNPPKSLAPFLTCDKFIALQVGPVGSTKTTAGIMKIAYHASRMAACTDGVRRSRAVWVRRSRQMLFDTSIKDFLSWYPPGVAGAWQKSDASFILKFGDVECEVLFRPMEDASDINRLLSLQVSFAIFDEFREISPDVFEAMQGRLGRYPDKRLVPHRPEWGLDSKGNPVAGCVTDDGAPNKHLWGMTNPPDADTYWETLLTEPPDNVAAFFQPSGMSPEADWLQYLPDNYYEDLAQGKSQDYIDVYIHSMFGRSLSGRPVFQCFDRQRHVANEPLHVLGSTVLIGVDAGLNPTATLGQVAYDGRLIIHDTVTGAEGGMGALRFAREILKPLLVNKYRGRDVAVIIDPAAFQRVQTDERCVADIFKAEGFSVRPAKTNAVAARLGACESYMTRNVGDSPALCIAPNNTLLIQALAGKYRYKVNSKGETDVKPEKSHPWSDVADSFQYLCLHADGGGLFGGVAGNRQRREIKAAPVRGWT